MEFELLSEKLGRFAEKGENARRLRSSAGKTSELGILEIGILEFGIWGILGISGPKG